MNTRTISKVAVYALIVYTVINVIFFIVSYMQSNLLSNYADGIISDDAFLPLATTNDTRMQIVAITLLVSLLTCFIVVGRWIYMACKMNHDVGTQGLQYTPGWSVGWLFIPIANLFKPVMAMAEIYRASFVSSDPIWQNRSLPFTFTIWWGCWVLTNIMGNISFRLSLDNGSFGGDYLSNVQTATQIDMASSVLDIFGSLCLISIIRTVAKNQELLESRVDTGIFD